MASEHVAGERALFRAVYDADEDAVVRLLRDGVRAEATDGEGQTALYLASVEDRPCIVRLLLAAGAEPERVSGHDADLPLCGATVGGHTEVVRSLLSAGARPDRREEFGFTAMVWAVGRGHAATVLALLEYGADPGLPGPGGEPPLVLAARRGSADCVRALLRHGASGLGEALAEARHRLSLDVEEELRRGLAQAYDSAGAFESVVRRVPEGDGITVVVELLRDGQPFAGDEQQTGHAAIATMLERELGIATSFAELARRALAPGDPRGENWTESVRTLSGRGDEETYQAAAAWCAGPDPLRQAFAVDVLAGLGFPDGPGPFAARSLPLLRELAAHADHPDLVQSLLAALAAYGDADAVEDVLRHAAHPSPAVRARVADALHGLARDDGTAAAEALVALAADPDPRVRARTATALAGLDTDSPEIRDALAALLHTGDADTAVGAARGLARRGDPRAADALAAVLEGQPRDSPAYAAALDAVPLVADPDAARTLRAAARRAASR